MTAPSKDKVLIREIRPEDNRALADIVRAGLASFGADCPDSGYNDPELDDLTASYAGPRAAFFAVELDGRLVGGGGVAVLKGASDDLCELQRMYLVPDARGCGLGRRLLNHCLAFARAQGYRRCYLETMTAMETARGLYRSEGFEPQAERSGATGHSACNLWFAKDL